MGFVLAALAFHLSLLWACYPYCSGADPVARYAPMADAFAVGNWGAVFHPRFCYVFQVLTGCMVWLTGIRGDVACQVIAMVFWCLSALPLFYLVRRVYDDRAAWISVAILLLIPELQVLAIEGMRDDVRIFPTLLMTLGGVMLLQENKDLYTWKPAVCLSVGMLMTIGLRVDCIMTSSLFVIFVAIACLLKHRYYSLIAALAGYVISLLINCWIVYSYTNWFLPVPHLIPYVRRMLA